MLCFETQDWLEEYLHGYSQTIPNLIREGDGVKYTTLGLRIKGSYTGLTLIPVTPVLIHLPPVMNNPIIPGG